LYYSRKIFVVYSGENYYLAKIKKKLNQSFLFHSISGVGMPLMAHFEDTFDIAHTHTGTDIDGSDTAQVVVAIDTLVETLVNTLVDSSVDTLQFGIPQSTMSAFALTMQPAPHPVSAGDDEDDFDEDDFEDDEFDEDDDEEDGDEDDNEEDDELDEDEDDEEEDDELDEDEDEDDDEDDDLDEDDDIEFEKFDEQELVSFDDDEDDDL
jgi:hypothetical protein